MRLLVGLGNPGPRYARNRHNIGFLALDEIARRHGFGAARSRFDALIAEGRVANDKVLALKPLTYMNESGRAVGAAMRYFRLAPEDVVVLHDDLDLVPGKVRVKTGGGAGGHNGLTDIDAHIGRDYVRVRLGIGRPAEKHRVTAYVLSDFAKADAEWLGPVIEAVADAMPLLIQGDAPAFMTRVAFLAPPPKPPETGSSPPPEGGTA